MDLKQLVAKPQLKLVKLDDAETVKEYGEALEFYVYDRQPVDVFVKMASLRSEDFGEIVKIVNSLILSLKDGFAASSFSFCSETHFPFCSRRTTFK